MAELRTLARPYAKAAFEFANASGQLTQWAESLATLSAVCQTKPLQALIASPSETAAVKAKKLLDVCGDTINSATGNLVNLLAENKRLALLPELYELFNELKLEQESSVDVLVKSAFPISTELENKLSSALKEKLKREVSVETTVDDTLVGGVLIKAGDIVIDDSIKGRLAKLSEAMNL